MRALQKIKAEISEVDDKEKIGGIAESNPDTIFITDLGGRFTYFTSAVKRFGYVPENLVGENFQDFLPESEAVQNFNNIAKGEIIKGLELMVLKKDGTPSYVEFDGSPLFKEGRVVGIVGIVRDITQSKKMEEKFKERAQLLDAATDSIVLRDLDGNIIYANVTACRAHGYSREEFMKMNIRDLNAPESVKQIEQGTMELMEKGEATYESVHIRKDKSTMPVEVHAQMIEVGGSPLVMSVARDITARKQAEERVRKLQEYLQLQIDCMPIGLITWDPEFHIRTWNPSATKIFGFSEKEALEKHPYQIIVPKEAQPHVDEIWDRLIKGEAMAHSVNENITKDGRTIICSWTNTPLKKDDGTFMGVLSMVQDITEQKKAEARERARLQAGWRFPRQFLFM